MLQKHLKVLQKDRVHLLPLSLSEDFDNIGKHLQFGDGDWKWLFFIPDRSATWIVDVVIDAFLKKHFNLWRNTISISYLNLRQIVNI